MTIDEVVATLEDGMTIGIGGWGARRKPMAVVRAIQALAGTLGIETIGEGVENEAQRATLRELGCTFGQGYLFGYPAPAEEWDVLRRRMARRAEASTLAPVVDPATLRAMQAALIEQNAAVDDMVMTDVCPFTLGVDTAKELGMQIKSGLSYFSEPTSAGWWFRPRREHVDYWLRHSLPVVVVLYDPDSDTCYWQLVSQATLADSRSGNPKILVPSSQVLDESAKGALRAAADRQVPQSGRSRSRGCHRVNRPQRERSTHACTDSGQRTKSAGSWRPPPGRRAGEPGKCSGGAL
jgi:hypothetical protein